MCSSCRYHSLRRLPHLHLPQKGDLTWLQRSEQRPLRLLFHPGMAVCPSPSDECSPLHPPAQEAVRMKNLLLRAQCSSLTQTIAVNRQCTWGNKMSENDRPLDLFSFSLKIHLTVLHDMQTNYIIMVASRSVRNSSWVSFQTYHKFWSNFEIISKTTCKWVFVSIHFFSATDFAQVWIKKDMKSLALR